MKDEKEILDLAHRTAWKYKFSNDPNHSDTYTFNAVCMIDFARKVSELEAAQQTIKWITNDGTVKPEHYTYYLIKTNCRKVVAYWDKDEDGVFHWMSTEGNSYSDTVISEFAEI